MAIERDRDELRDRFALEAARALLGNTNVAKLFCDSGFLPGDHEWTERIGVASYEVADAMLKARNRPEPVSPIRTPNGGQNERKELKR